MTVTGTVQKFRMREMAIAELRLEEAAQITTACELGRCRPPATGACARTPAASAAAP
jgi:hypothetical protein